MSGPEALLMESARRNSRIPPAHELVLYAESEGVDPGLLFEGAPPANEGREAPERRPSSRGERPPARRPDLRFGRGESEA